MANNMVVRQDDNGNLKRATRNAGSPVVIWDYEYRPLDGVEQDQVKAALNEIKTIRVKHDGVLQGTSGSRGGAGRSWGSCVPSATQA